MGAVGAWSGQAGVAGTRVANHNHSALPHEGCCHSSYCREAKEEGRTTCVVRPLFITLQSVLSLCDIELPPREFESLSQPIDVVSYD